MATANRVLNILLVGAALMAVGLSVRLYAIRQEARTRGYLLATTVNQAWAHLDGGSAALDWATFHADSGAVRNSLFRFESTARGLRDERDAQRQLIAKLRDDLAATRQDLAQTRQTLDETRAELAQTQGVCERYAGTLKSIGSELGKPPANLEAAGLEQLQQTVTAMKTQAAQVPKLLAINDELSASLKQMRAEVGLYEEQVAKQGNQISKLSGDVERWTAIAEARQPPTTTPTPTSLPDGTIVMVNYDYNYAIVDLGRRQRLPLGLELTVNRQGEYIGDLRVSRVYEHYAVAEIMPPRGGGLVIQGDNVAYLPPVAPLVPSR
jgi:hypothetical protein